MSKYPNAQVKTFTVTFPKKSGVGSNVVVTIAAGSPESALAQARHALIQTADQPESAVTVA